MAASTDVDALLATDADCVMYSPLLPDEQVVMRILRSGKNVVTPVGWVYPDRQSPAVQAIEASAYGFPWTRGNFIDSLAAGFWYVAIDFQLYAALVLLAAALEPSVAVTRIDRLPTSPLAGVPLKLRVPGVKLSQVGSNVPSASVAE